MSRRSPWFVAPVTALALASFSLAACGKAKVDATVAVEGTETACTPAATSIAPGRIAFAFSNKAGIENELYETTPEDKILGEVEGVGVGSTRNLTVTLKAGTYKFVCKPGKKGDGISTPFTITG